MYYQKQNSLDELGVWGEGWTSRTIANWFGGGPKPITDPARLAAIRARELAEDKRILEAIKNDPQNFPVAPTGGGTPVTPTGGGTPVTPTGKKPGVIGTNLIMPNPTSSEIPPVVLGMLALSVIGIMFYVSRRKAD